MLVFIRDAFVIDVLGTAQRFWTGARAAQSQSPHRRALFGALIPGRLWHCAILILTSPFRWRREWWLPVSCRVAASSGAPEILRSGDEIRLDGRIHPAPRNLRKGLFHLNSHKTIESASVECILYDLDRFITLYLRNESLVHVKMALLRAWNL
jgi:hypothetical protein